MGIDFKFIHCSDLHLGAPFKKVSSFDRELGKRMAEAPFAALDRIVDKAITENADFIIFSGDIFDSENITPGSRHRFAEAVKRAGIRCYIAYGNHDHRRSWENSIPLPGNAVVFPDTPVNIPYPDGENKLTNVIGVSHGAKEEGRDLTDGITGTGPFSIAAVHCDLDAVSEGKRYAPCRLNDLLTKNIDYWALGHIHKRSIVHEYPHVVYPGNTQGRNTKETGRKGAYLVTVSGGKVANIEFFATHEIMWSEAELDITGKDINSLIGHLPDIGPGELVKLKITGRGDLDRMIRFERKDIIRAVEDRKGCRVVDIEVNSMPNIDINARRNTGDFVSAVIREADIMSGSDKKTLISAICATKASQSPEIRKVFEDMSETELKDMVNDALASILGKLTGDST
ncbi:MAG: DNA repair exonuclease [Methanomassiliicoccaceae archaeon]|nr:DNA repair exonuclease [Methanomassiliicoccaceae archaeon]